MSNIDYILFSTAFASLQNLLQKTFVMYYMMINYNVRTVHSFIYHAVDITLTWFTVC